MPKIGANFDYISKEPNFRRDSFETIAKMAVYDVIDEGHISWCQEDNRRYEYRSTNSVDPNTGRWRVYKPGDTTEAIPISHIKSLFDGS